MSGINIIITFMFSRIRFFSKGPKLVFRPTYPMMRFCSTLNQSTSLSEYWLFPDNYDTISESVKASWDQNKLWLCITDECIKRVNKLKAKNENYKYLKVQVDSGGCSGFSYDIKMCDTIEDSDIIFTKDDVTLLVDEITLEMIKGSKIDYKDEMIRSSFEVIDNPNASMSCSCGTSFAPKGLDGIFGT